MKNKDDIEKELQETKAMCEEAWRIKKEAEERVQKEIEPLVDRWFKLTERVGALTRVLEVLNEDGKPF